MAKINYQVHAYIGVSSRALQRFVTIIGTVAGSSYIRKSIIPTQLLKKIQQLTRQSDVLDANIKRVQIDGNINFACRVGTRAEIVYFNVVEKLGKEVVLGSYYLDRHVESIKPRGKVIKLADGSTVPIVRRSGGSLGNSPLQEDEDFKKHTPRANRAIKVTKPTTPQPNANNWVDVVTDQPGLIVVEPVQRLYKTSLCLVGNGIAEIEANKPLR